MSTPKTVLITGATGLLGRQIAIAFQRTGWTVVGTGLTRATPPIVKLDLSDEAAVAKIFEDTKPQVVVHSAANRNPETCASDPTGTRTLNVTTSRLLARLCAARSILLIYISTDYVFPGTPGDAPYTASHTPAPTNFYGQTKWEGEQAVLEECSSAVVLRVPVLYGHAETNAESAVNTLVDAVWKAQGGKVNMDHWAKRFPTNTEDVGRVVEEIAQLYLTPAAEPRPSVLQFSSEDQYTKYEMCAILAEILGLSMEKMEANTQGNEPGAAVQRPYDCHLSTQELKELGIGLHTMDFKGWWRRELRAVRH